MIGACTDSEELNNFNLKLTKSFSRKRELNLIS